MNDAEKLVKAFTLAYKAHKGQTRNFSKEPYINHPIRVVKNLLHYGVTDIDTMCIALLHDTIEDTDLTYEKITQELHDVNIAIVVRALTKTGKTNFEYYSNLYGAHENFRMVKLCDRLDNIQDLHRFSAERKRKYIQETKEFIYPLAAKTNKAIYEDIKKIIEENE